MLYVDSVTPGELREVVPDEGERLHFLVFDNILPFLGLHLNHR